MPSDYSSKQLGQEADYAKQYKEWIDGMSAEERREMAELGLTQPLLAKHGNGAPDGDVADSPRASYKTDISGIIDGKGRSKESAVVEEVTRILRHIVADMISAGNARLTIECFAVALGLSAYNGESMTEIAKKHGITRAAVSKRCVDITKRLGLPPSRAMRSLSARKTYSRTQLRLKRDNGTD